MNKQELATAISRRVAITHREAVRRIDLIFEIITHQLMNNDSVKLRGFGTFINAPRAQKTIINPKTKQSITVPARNVPTFVPSTILKDQIQNI